MHPWVRAWDYYQLLRESGRLGWVGGEPFWDHGTNRPAFPQGCPGIPEQRVGHRNSCYPSPPDFPGLADPIALAPGATSYSMWGEVQLPDGRKLWYPARGYDRAPGKPLVMPQLVPGGQTIPAQPAFPPAAPGPVRHLVPRPRFRDPVPDKPVKTKPDKPDRKMNAPPWLVAGMKAAFAGTEVNDAIDAFWDAMPADIKKATPKTYKCTTGCRNPGTKYHGPLDKARAIAKHWKNLPPEVIAKGLAGVAANHFIDEILGRFFGGADNARKRIGGSGWGFGIG